MRRQWLPIAAGVAAFAAGDWIWSYLEVIRGVEPFPSLADVLLAGAPALFLVIVTAKLGGGLLAWPWRTVAAGVVLLAFADTMFAWQGRAGVYGAGSLTDYGWLGAHVLIAVGASLARDVSRPMRIAVEPEGEAAA